MNRLAAASNPVAPAPLRADEVETFWRDGVLCLRNVFSDWVGPLRTAIEEVLVAPGPLSQNPARPDYATANHPRKHSFYIELGLWTRHPTFRAFAIGSPAADIARQLLTAPVNLFFDQLFVKEPGSPTQTTPWHQDQSYWAISGKQVLSVWAPLDPVVEGTGALRYAKGSHRWPSAYGPRDFGDGHREVPGVPGEAIPDLDAHPERYSIVSWDLAPGDCLVHHGSTMHAAGGNSSEQTRRRAHSVRFTGSDVRWDPRPGILERIPLMTTLPLSLRAGDPLTCDAFPVVRT